MKLQRRVLAIITVIAAALALVVVGLIAARDKPVLPKDVMSRINYTVYVPDSETGGDSWNLRQEATAFDNEMGVLSITVTSGGNTMYIKQQALPAAFNDIPNYYNTMLDKLHQYAEFQTSLGAVTLTRPEELSGKQSAVLNADGTLMFLSPDQDLSEDQWKDFFSRLRVIR